MAIFANVCSCANAQTDREEKYTIVSPSQFAEDIKSDKSAFILDVRTPEEYAEGHIESAHNLNWLNQDEFKAKAPSLPKDRTLYVYCRSGKRSAEASDYLSNLGYRVVDLDGGYMAWVDSIK